MLKLMATSAVALLGLSVAAQAASYNFDYVYDGTTLSLVGGSDTPDGTVLNDGDDFRLTMSAAGTDYWDVVVAVVGAFVPLSFAVTESGDRIADISTSWKLDGSEVASRTDTNQLQQYVHVGAQEWDLAAGLLFDQVVIDYTLLSATEADGGPLSVSTEITQFSSDFILQDSHAFFDGGPSSGVIEYRSAAVVPLPAGALLYLPVLLMGGGIAALRRRKT